MKPWDTIAVCWGAGRDSTAMLIEMERRGIRPALITFADVGGEKNRPDPQQGDQIGTYDFIPIFSQWCEDHDFPRPTVCEYRPKADTRERYLESTRAVIDRLGLSIDEPHVERLARLYGNMVANDTMPGIAFGPKSCSLKWKLEAQEPT